MGLATGEDSEHILSSPSSAAGFDSQPLVFYGVCRPRNFSVDDDHDGVFVDKKEALLAVKNNRDARFKAFKTYHEALSFSKNASVQLSVSQSSGNPGSAPAKASDNGESLAQLGGSAEKPKTFRGPKAQDLVKLRKLIEKGNAESFRETAWENPRYLISSGDTPTILHEGPRYNALHIAAKFKQPPMCKLILDIIEDPAFMQLLYSDDSPTIRVKRINNLVDLYLNMPDKGCCETPLHFAAKFGCHEIVDILTSHPACDKELRNKFDQTARDVAGSRCPFADVRRKIENSLEDRYFVPVLGAEDNTCQPFVGEPFSPHDAPSPLQSPNFVSPLEPSLIIRALAGPMSPKQADELHRMWRKPSYMKSSTPLSGRARLLGIRLSDTDKGLERIGRELADELRVPWSERWPFMDSFCDLSKAEGLGKLETYLRNNYNVLSSQAKPAAPQEPSFLDDYMPVFDEGRDSSNATLDGSLDSLCRAFRHLRIHSSPNSFHSPRPAAAPPCRRPSRRATPPRLQEITSLHILDQVCLDIAHRVACELHERMAQGRGREIRLDFVDKVRPGVECLLRVAKHSLTVSEAGPDCAGLHLTIARHVGADVEENAAGGGGADSFVLNSASDEESGEEDLSRWRGYACNRAALKEITLRHLRCVLGNVVLLMKGDGGARCECDWAWDFAQVEEAERGKCGAEERGKLFIENNAAGGPPPGRGAGKEGKEPSGTTPEHDKPGSASSFYGQASDCDPVSDDSTDFYVTPPSSFLSSRNSSFSDAHTPDEGIAIFINGSQPTKLDLDVLRALEKVTVDPVIYPHINRWQHLVSLFTKEEVERWPTPSSARLKRVALPQAQSSLGWESSPCMLTSTPSRPSRHEGASEPCQTNLYERVFANLVPE